MSKMTVWMTATALLLLCACTSQDAGRHIVDRDGETFFIDTAAGAVLHGDDVYDYTQSGDTITITYPDGSTFWWTQQNHAGYGGWSDDYGSEQYISGHILADLLFDAASPRLGIMTIKVLGALAFAAIGAWQMLYPRAAWYLSRGWQYKNAAPSDAALAVARIGGAAFILFGIIILFI